MLVRTGFGQRRKMLRRSLAGIVAPDTYEAAGIAPTARPEELDVDAWCRLTDAHLAAERTTAPHRIPVRRPTVATRPRRRDRIDACRRRTAPPTAARSPCAPTPS
jgi:hypothetical protein